MPNLKYPKLFSPVRIGHLEIKSWVAMTAMGVNLAAVGGGVNDDIIAFYEARARGGVGLIVSGVCRVMDGPGAGESCQLAARNMTDLQGLARLADTVHKYGTRIFLQLQHPGGTYGLGPEQPVAASAVESLLGSRTPRALSVPEIHQIQAAFVDGARIAQMAGVDGVELHGAHGYLINSFLSPRLNHRTDLYGGNFENRLRFLLEIVAGTRAACGKTFPLGVRLSVEEFLGDQGNDLAASCLIAAELEKSGVDFIDVSCRCLTPDSPNCAACIEPGTYAQGWKKYMAAEIKRHVNIPVIAVANIKEPDVAEAILAGGCCDLVGVARGHLADPEWCNKAKAGRADTIRKCIGCLVCFDEIEHGRHVKCSVNPVTGREREFAHPERNGAERKVAVIGGGPAGITAALVLQQRGFHPVLFDPSPRLGGTLNVADKGIHREKIARLVDSLIAQVADSGIEVRLGQEATVQKVQALSPAGVFIAWGARPFIPPVPGVDGDNVVTAQDVLLGWAQAKGDCVIVGSGMTGLETAEVVLSGGHKATIVEMLPQIGTGAEPIVLGDIMHRLAPYHPDYLPGHRLEWITPDGVDLECVATQQPVSVPADTVILALGVRPRADVVEGFKAASPEARFVGDAVRGGRIVDATQDAYGQAFVFEPEINGAGGPSAMTETSEYYRDKVAVVTGGASGIGLALAETMLSYGARRVVLADVNDANLEREAARLSTAHPGKVLGIHCDVTNEQDVQDMIQRAAQFGGGRIDLLFNNAGAGLRGNFDLQSNEDWQKAFALNFYGALYSIRAVLPIMRAHGSGHIVDVISGIAFVPMAYQTMYAATKAALNGLTLALRYELWDENIRVTSATPGTTATPIWKTAGPPPGAQSPEQSAQTILAGVARNERLVLGDQDDVRGARICFAPEAAETADELLLNVARKRRQGEWVVG